MKKILLLLLTLGCCTNLVYGQWGVSVHQSNLPFVGVNYDFTKRISADLRLGTDLDLYNFSPELLGTYDYVNKTDFELYAGLGARANVLGGVVLPIGFRVFPFENKNFGFHIEVSPIFSIEDDAVFRGSWGIRYRFIKQTESEQ